MNYCLDKYLLLPLDLKLADVIPVYNLLKINYRPVSIVSNISKVYERCIYDHS